MAGLARTEAITLSLAINAGLLALLALEDRRPVLRRMSSSTPIYLDIEPVFITAPVRRATTPPVHTTADRSARPLPQPFLGRASTPFVTPLPEDAPGAEPPSSSPLPTPTLQSPETTKNAGIDARWRVDGAVAGPSPLPVSCDLPHRLSRDARRRCEERWIGAEAVPAIPGTGDAERDAAFARQGARRLAAWEAQRAEPSRVNRSCENPNPVAGCADVDIRIDLFSSRDGFLPNLRKRRE